MGNFIHSRKKVQIRDFQGQSLVIPKDFMGKVPEWVVSDPYFKLLIKDDTISIVGASADEKATAAPKEDAPKEDATVKADAAPKAKENK
jgi:hypothetical protein